MEVLFGIVCFLSIIAYIFLLYIYYKGDRW